MALIDIDKQFEDIKKSAIGAIQSVFPIERKKHKMVLKKVWVEDTSDVNNYKEQKSAKLRGSSWGANVFAELNLVDIATNKVIDKEPKIKLFLLPKLTPRASYIVKGNEYQVANQLRLKSGAYVKKRKDGGVKTHFNLARGGAAELHINDKGIINMKIKQGQIALYPLLIGLGIPDSTIKNVWGEDVWNQNKNSKITPQAAIKKLATSFASLKSQSVETLKDGLKTYLKEKTEINPEMTKLTLGKAHSSFSPELWLDASKKLIAVERGTVEPDDVDNLAFKEFYGIEDSLKERIEKNKRMISSKINRNLDSRDKIREIITVNTLGKLVESFFTQDDRSSTPEQINPLHMYSGHEKVTFLGPGSISSLKQVTEEMRNVHPTHLSYLDPVHTPESEKIGLALSLAMGTKKKGNNLESSYWNFKTKKYESLSPDKVFEKYVSYPDQWDPKTRKLKGAKIKAQFKGKIVSVGQSQIDYAMPFAQNAFSLSTNLIPFMANDNGNRTMMAGKHMEQAIPLKLREAPLVQNRMPLGSKASFEDVIGAAHAVYATTDGTPDGTPIKGKVSRIDKDSITIKDGRNSHKINLYNNFSLNQKTFINHEPNVAVGDTITPRQHIADSNFTKKGTLALGTNLTTAYLPYKGYNFEDGLVISESASKKLTSEHIHKNIIEVGEKTILDLNKFIVNFPNELSIKNKDKLDSDGVMKKGSTVSPGDVVISALRFTGGLMGSEVIKARFDKSLGSKYKSDASVWNKDIEGKVVDVQKTSAKVTVFIKTEERARIGDKLAGRHGNKGIITKILSDSLTPHDKDGNPVDLLMNPHGVISRINIGQMYESALGKVALKKGAPVKISNFTGENYLESVKKELASAGLKDTEELFDPETGKSLGNVHVGNPYILKLNKQSDVNFSVRGESGPVSRVTEQPTKGGEEGSKSMDMLTMFSMLSHGAKANLQEMSTIKSENNPEFWEAIKYGRPLPAPKTPFVFNKFINMLKGSGVDVQKTGSKFVLAPLIDKQVKAMSKMEVTKPMFYRASKGGLIDEKGGFLDSVHLGGSEGTNWGHIKLKEISPNPIFENAIKELTGLVKEDYNSIVKGTKTVEINGKSLTGGKALKGLLSQINVEKELKAISAELPGLKKTKRNDAIKKFRLLSALKKQNLSPVEAYMRHYVPVVPPKFRPITVLKSGDFAADDSNVLYRNVSLLNKQLNLPVVDLLDDEDLVEVREELNKNLKGLSGLDSVKFSGRDKSGFIHNIKGNEQPKEGFYQNKVLRKNQNLVGRGTIIPEPNLHMDQVGLPDKMAWKLYMPFVIRELISQGLTSKRAKEEIDLKSSLAKYALEKAMSKRPVMLNRAPSLHKFSIMAFNPTLTEGKAIKIPPLVVNGFNADFDGDTMTVHVPIKDKAIREAYKMMPSRNLWKPGTGDLMVGPSQESQLGFYLMTKDPKDRATLNKLLPKKHHINREMNKGASRKLFMTLSKTLDSEVFSRLIDKIKILGEGAAYTKGFSLSLKDLDLLKGKDSFMKELEVEAAKVHSGKSTAEQFSNKLLGKNGIQERLDAKIKSQLKGKNNSLYEMVNSGARGNYSQLRQIVASPLIVQDPTGGLIATPIKKSFTEGLDLSDYWIASYGARKGMMDRALSTKDPGVFNKAMMAVSMDNVISTDDCKTTDGVRFPVSSPEILGRFLQGNQAGISDETVVDENIIKRLKKSRLRDVFVRSPLKCRALNGTCRHCYGIDEKGSVVSIGDNIGALAGQTIAEPMTQLIMNTFHTGGVAGTGTKGGYKRVKELLDMPMNIKKGKAVLAEVSGKIEDIKPSGLGGYNIFIQGKKHVTPSGQKKLVNVGDLVQKGDSLNVGSIAPQEILKYKGMETVQNYLTDELHKAYSDQDINIDRKTFETIIRSVSDRTRVLNNAKNTPWLPGESVSYSTVMDYNKNVSNEDEKVLHEPYLKGIKYLPQEREDWLAQMGATHLKDAIVNGASQGWMSDTKGYHPIPAFAYGANFGEGQEGRF